MHDPCARAPESSQDFRKHICKTRAVNADQLSRWAHWIEQRPEQIKNRARVLPGEANAHLGERTKSRMIFSGKNKSESESFEAFL